MLLEFARFGRTAQTWGGLVLLGALSSISAEAAVGDTMLVFPHPGTVDLRFTLFDAAGEQVASSVQRAPFDPNDPNTGASRAAFFISQLFPELPDGFARGTLAGITEVDTMVLVTFALALRLRDPKPPAPLQIGSGTIGISDHRGLSTPRFPRLDGGFPASDAPRWEPTPNVATDRCPTLGEGPARLSSDQGRAQASRARATVGDGGHPGRGLVR